MMMEDDDSSAYSDYSCGSDYDLSDDEEEDDIVCPSSEKKPLSNDDCRLIMTSDDLSLSNRLLPMTNDSSLGSNWVDSETTMNFSSRNFHNDGAYIMTGNSFGCNANLSIDSSALGYEEASPDTCTSNTSSTSAGDLPPCKIIDLARADSGYTVDCTTDDDSDDDDDDDSTFYSNSSVGTDLDPDQCKDDFQPSSYYDTRRRNSLVGGRRSSLSGLARVRRPSLTPSAQDLGYECAATPNNTEDLGYGNAAGSGGPQLRRSSTFGGRRSSITGMARVRRPSVTPSVQEDLGYGCAAAASTPNSTEDLGYGKAAGSAPQLRRTSTFGGRRSSITGLARVRRPSVTPSPQDLGYGCAVESTPNTEDLGYGKAAGNGPQLRRSSTFGGTRSSITGMTGGGARRQSMSMSARRPSMLGKPSLEPIEDQSESNPSEEQSMQDLGCSFEDATAVSRDEALGCAASRVTKVKDVKGVIDKVRKKIKAGLKKLDEVLQQVPTNHGVEGYGNAIPDNDALDYGYGYAVPDSDDLGYDRDNSSNSHRHHHDEFAPAIYYETRRRNSLRGDVRDGLARVRRHSLSASQHTQVSCLTDNSASYQNHHQHGGDEEKQSSRWEQIERRSSESLPLCPQRRRQSNEDSSPPEHSTYTSSKETDNNIPNRWESDECVCEKKLSMSSRRSSVTLPARPSRRTSCGSVAA